MFFFLSSCRRPPQLRAGGGQGNLATLAVARDCMFCLLFFVRHVILFFLYVFSARHFPPLAGLRLRHISFSCWFSPFVSSPRHDGSLREGFDVGFPCLRACVLQFAFLRLPPPATVTVRGRVLTVVRLAIAPFSSRPPPATLAVRGRFLTGGLPFYSDCDSFNYFLRVFPGVISRTRRGVGVGFEESHLRFMV